MITKIHFIVNPVAGSGKNALSKKVLDEVFDKGFYEIILKESQYSGHAVILAKESVDEKAEIIVACGGDGTINEVASSLVNTKVILGIVPMGSGNGLASHLKIPRNIVKALKIIKHSRVTKIDVGSINETYFFSNTGIGFDAHVVSDFEKNTTRKLWGYAKSVIKGLRSYEYTSVKVQYQNKIECIKPFLLFISNSNEMGYKMSLTPKASLQDGILDIIIVPKLSPLKMFLFTILFFIKKHHWLKEVKFIKAESLNLSGIGYQLVKAQKDGENITISEDRVNIKLLEKALKVCIN